MKDYNFWTSKEVWNFNSFIFLIIFYLMIAWDSFYFYNNSFYFIEKIWIILFNIFLIWLLLWYKNNYKKIEVNTITYKYTVDEYIIEIIKSFIYIFKKSNKPDKKTKK